MLLHRLRAHWRPTLALALPVAVGQLGVMLMAIVDTAMVAPLGRAAVGGMGVAMSLVTLAFLFGIGTLLGLDHEVAVAQGAGRDDDVGRFAVQGLWLALLASVLITAGLLAVRGHIALLGVAPELVAPASTVLSIAAWSLGPALLFIALRQALQATGAVMQGTVVLLAANVVNLLGNFVLVRGRFGAPALGVAGSATATVISRVFMLVALGAWALRARPTWWRHLAPDLPRLRVLLRLGLPAAFQFLFEGGVFSLATVLAARLGALPAAAHQVVLQVASFSFMVPLGISAAGAVRVGHALGRGDREGARLAGWCAVLLGGWFMVLSGVGLTLAWRPVLGIFVLDAGVTELARKLLLCAAFFQLFDGLQVTLAGVLRGWGETTPSLIANLLGHWLVGLPIGCALAFGLHLGAVGLWMGLAAGLAAVSAALLLRWRSTTGPGPIDERAAGV